MSDDLCESCTAERMWETDRVQPVWAYPYCTCKRVAADRSE